VGKQADTAAPQYSRDEPDRKDRIKPKVNPSKADLWFRGYWPDQIQDPPSPYAADTACKRMHHVPSITTNSPTPTTTSTAHPTTTPGGTPLCRSFL